MKIAVICANGKAGKLITKEAVDRGLDVTARQSARTELCTISRTACSVLLHLRPQPIFFIL